MTPTPANMPKPKPTHVRNARTPDGQRIAYQTSSAKLAQPVADSVAPTPGRMVTNPKAIRVTPTPVVNPVRVIASPVTVRHATPAERARLMRPTPLKPSPWSS